MDVKHFTYKKDSGAVSQRACIVISEPRTNYLMLDVADLKEEELNDVLSIMQEIEDFREERMYDIKELIKWRTFKPSNITWNKVL